MKTKTRSERLKKTLKNALWSFGWTIFAVTMGIWNISMWLAGSSLSFWMAIMFFICGGGQFYFFKKDWNKIAAICAEINS